MRLLSGLVVTFLLALSVPRASGGELLDHELFKICYAPSFRLARYVQYELTAEQLKKRFIKRDADPFDVEPS